MANRYWVDVNPANAWDTFARSSWATSSGGAGGASAPTAADDVFFDSNSNQAVQVTIGSGAACRSLNCSGWGTGGGALVFEGGTLSVGDGTLGNITMGVNQIHAGTGTGTLSLVSTAGASGYNFINMNGVTMPAGINIVINGANGKWALDSNMTIGGSITINTGILNLNDKNLSCSNLVTAAGNAKELRLGAGTVTLTGTGDVFRFDDSGDVTFDPGTSTIIVSDTSASSKSFLPAGLDCYNLSILGGGAGTVTINSGDCDFNVISLSGPKTVIFANTTTTGVSNLTTPGGGVVTIQSDSAGAAFTLSKASGEVIVSNVSLKDSTATGGASFTAQNSTNVSGNTGWTFVSTGNSRGFLTFFE